MSLIFLTLDILTLLVKMNSSFDNHETQPPVTVVIPAYNLILYLADAVNSVLQQRYSGAITLVILDDGSTDKTYQLACQMAEEVPNVKVYTQENKGGLVLLNSAESEISEPKKNDWNRCIYWINIALRSVVA